MFKKTIISLFLILGIAQLNAQNTPGSWKVIPMSGYSFSNVQDTPGKVYFLSNGSLYNYDKESDEMMYFSPGSKISDSGISFIKYNPDNKYTLLVYTNGNIDLIYDNGKVVNMPEIKDANLTIDKAVTTATFGKDRIYIGTSFGLVVYNDKDHYVVESGIYNTPIDAVVELGDKILVWNGANAYYAPKTDRHNALSKFTPMGQIARDNITPISDTEYLTLSVSGSNKELWKVTPDFTQQPVDLQLESLGTIPSGKTIERYKDGYFIAGNNGFYITDGNTPLQCVEFPEQFAAQSLSFWKAPTTFWAGDQDGIGSYALAQGVATPQVSKFFPESSKQGNTWYHIYSKDGSEVYISDVGWAESVPGSDYVWGVRFPYIIEGYNWDTGTITPYYPTPQKQYNTYTQEEQDKTGINLLYGGGAQTTIDDEGYIYAANSSAGLFIIKDREIIGHFDQSNSPIRSTNADARTFACAFDQMGNLWIGFWRCYTNIDDYGSSPYRVISKEGIEAFKKDHNALYEKDSNGNYKYWQIPSTTNSAKSTWKWQGFVEMSLMFLKSSATKGLSIEGPWRFMSAFDTKGTTTVSDDSYQTYVGFIDQDGNRVEPSSVMWMEEDVRNGWVWVGTNVGVFVIKNLAQLADGSSSYISAVRPKVARNDGSSYADYLLASDHVISIAIDGSNNKWFATKTSGVYCTNPDGTQMLYEFNSENSPLVSDVASMVACNPNGNDVLIGTPEGLFVYSSDSAPAKEDYSEAFAYPNPVRPDYTGWITINGLMDNSLIKITDAQGHVVWTGTSQGGMAVWDGCYSNSGDRVRSGVYHIMASEASGKGTIIKIVVIN